MESRRQPPGIELMPCPFWRRFNSIYRRGFLFQKKKGNLEISMGLRNLCVSAHFHSHIFFYPARLFGFLLPNCSGQSQIGFRVLTVGNKIKPILGPTWRMRNSQLSLIVWACPHWHDDGGMDNSH